MIFVLFLMNIALHSEAQSAAFKALLNTIYDKDFPLVQHTDSVLIQNAILLDTRELEEFEISHLQGAQWVGYNTFTLKNVSHIPKDSLIVVYCSVGARSQDIGKRLKQAGYKNVYNLYGGIFHWVNEEKPIVKDQSLVTDEVHTFNKTWGMWVKKGKKVY